MRNLRSRRNLVDSFDLSNDATFELSIAPAIDANVDQDGKIYNNLSLFRRFYLPFSSSQLILQKKLVLRQRRRKLFLEIAANL